MITEPPKTEIPQDSRTLAEYKAARVGLLDDYISRRAVANEINCHERTVARYELGPDGLPSVLIAGRKYYHIRDVRAFLERRIVRPNPVRRAG